MRWCSVHFQGGGGKKLCSSISHHPGIHRKEFQTAFLRNSRHYLRDGAEGRTRSPWTEERERERERERVCYNNKCSSCEAKCGAPTRSRMMSQEGAAAAKETEMGEK